MSAGQKELSAFKASVASSASKISNKRFLTSTPGAISGRASPAPQTSNAKTDLKRKRPEPANIVYSQPADTGVGTSLATNITYAIDHLKTKGVPLSLPDVIGYLSIQNHEAKRKKYVAQILQSHPKVRYDPAGFDGKGAYSFRPFHDISNSVQLLAYLQAQRTAQGLSVKELKEGWPNVEEEIDRMESEHKLLVTRNKKDRTPKMVWADDPSLHVEFDQEFKNIWHEIRLIDPPATIEFLEKHLLTPTNKSAPQVVAPKVPKKKVKKSRISTKMTNTHMTGLLRDFSHKRVG